MNRCIKFRIWFEKEKRWLHGPHEMASLDGINLLGETILFGGFLDGVSIKDLNDIIALQFTELKDKNGREIFEGDVVKFHYFGFNGSETDNNGAGEITYNSNLCCFMIRDLKDREIYFSFDRTSHFEEPCIEVIGNIFDNPELLNSK